MKNIVRMILLLCIACFVCACHESETEKLQKLAAKIGHNKPLIIESVKRHKVNYEMPSFRLVKEEINKDIPIHSLEEAFAEHKTLITFLCVLETLNTSICTYNMNLHADSKDNNTWIVTVERIGGPEKNIQTSHSFKVLKDKKRIIPMNEISCQALDLNLARLLNEKQKHQEDPIDWEKECSFPIKFVKGIK